MSAPSDALAQRIEELRQLRADVLADRSASRESTYWRWQVGAVAFAIDILSGALSFAPAADDRDAAPPRRDECFIFVRVYRMPDRLTDGYCFGRGVPITFQNVDWFVTRDSEGRSGLVEFIRTKVYFDPTCRFLVIGDKPEFTFTIDPERRS